MSLLSKTFDLKMQELDSPRIETDDPHILKQQVKEAHLLNHILRQILSVTEWKSAIEYGRS